jgi:hypothetical protein
MNRRRPPEGEGGGEALREQIRRGSDSICVVVATPMLVSPASVLPDGGEWVFGGLPELAALGSLARRANVVLVLGEGPSLATGRLNRRSFVGAGPAVVRRRSTARERASNS